MRFVLDREASLKDRHVSYERGTFFVNVLSSVSTLLAAIAAGAAAYAAFSQRTAQFTSVLYGKQVDLVADADTAMQSFGVSIKTISEGGHQMADFQRTNQQGLVFLNSLRKMNLVLPQDARRIVNDMIGKTIDLQMQMDAMAKPDPMPPLSVQQRSSLYQKNGALLSELNAFLLCGYQQFVRGRQFVEGDISACQAAQPFLGGSSRS